jgi:type VI secretion system protein ImpI
MRSSSRTMIRALENNPLKFSAAPEEALAIMFGPPTRNYLNAPTTVERSFADLKAHQMQTFGAIQGALEALFDDLAPQRIDSSVEPERGIGALVGSRKAKLWDVYVERWKAKSKRSDGRLNEAFMALFAESYDKLRGQE